MTVKVISYTKSLSNKDSSLTDIVAYTARVSNPSNQNNTETNDKLINYLIKNKHWSPFEMVNICLEIETTRDIARQILRHRSFSFQEFSQRYAVADLGFMPKEARMQDKKNRQNSLECEDDFLTQEWEQKQQLVMDKSQEVYTWAINNGIAKEQARAVLPEGNTKSRMYVNGTLRSWIHYIDVRTSNGTQQEHKDVAIKCALEISKIFPLILDFMHTDV
jgi:thymidylate synthase (FAD)